MPRFARGLIVSTALALAAPAAAQLPYEPMLVADEAPKAAAGPQPAASESTDFRMPRAAIRPATASPPAGMIAAMPLAERLTMGVGRFSVLEEPRVRTHTEPAYRAAEVRRRESGIAAVGVSLSF